MSPEVERGCEGCDNVIETVTLTEAEHTEYSAKGGNNSFRDGFCPTCKDEGKSASSSGTTKTRK